MNNSQSSEATRAKRVDVFASLPMEAKLRSLNLNVPFRFPSDGQPSLETQQLDEAKQIDVLIAHHENLKKLMKAEKPTGIPHLFVLDPDKLAVGDLDAQTTLQALANAQFTDSGNLAAAFLPPENGYTPAGQDAAKLVKDTILLDAGIATLEGISELEAWLTAR